MNFQDYIMPELLVLIPVLYLLGAGIKNSDLIPNKHIPIALGCAGIVLCGLYVFANGEVHGGNEIATALFTAVTQGVLIAGASVYVNQIIKQEGKDK